MGKFLNALYAHYANPGVLEIIRNRKLEIDWAIEAGCHDGADTLRILELPGLRHIYAFEPDPVAAEIAVSRFRSYASRITLSSSALYSKSGLMKMILSEGRPGSGNTIFKFFDDLVEDTPHVKPSFKCTTVDHEIKENSNKGLFWLDVEGSPHRVIEGAKNTLTQIVIAQIEVDMHDMHEMRQANFREVHTLMRRGGFMLYAAPLHPGYFGDVIYLKEVELSLSEKVKARALTFAMHILHYKVYSLLKKPN